MASSGNTFSRSPHYTKFTPDYSLTYIPHAGRLYGLTKRSFESPNFLFFSELQKSLKLRGEPKAFPERNSRPLQALSVAPGVSMKYWKKLMQRYDSMFYTVYLHNMLHS
jgi:hypothetical protein